MLAYFRQRSNTRRPREPLPALSDFPVGSELMVPRVSNSGSIFYSWCAIVAHKNGELIVHVENEGDQALSLHTLHGQAQRLAEGPAGALLEEVTRLRAANHAANAKVSDLELQLASSAVARVPTQPLMLTYDTTSESAGIPIEQQALTSSEALCLAQQEGLELMRSTRAGSRFRGVTCTRPLATRPLRGSQHGRYEARDRGRFIGGFSCAEAAALAFARHRKEEEKEHAARSSVTTLDAGVEEEVVEMEAEEEEAEEEAEVEAEVEVEVEVEVDATDAVEAGAASNAEANDGVGGRQMARGEPTVPAREFAAGTRHWGRDGHQYIVSTFFKNAAKKAGRRKYSSQPTYYWNRVHGPQETPNSPSPEGAEQTWERLQLICAITHARLKDPAKLAGCRHQSRCNYQALKDQTTHGRRACPIASCPAKLQRLHDIKRDDHLRECLKGIPQSEEFIWVQGAEVLLENEWMKTATPSSLHSRKRRRVVELE